MSLSFPAYWFTTAIYFNFHFSTDRRRSAATGHTIANAAILGVQTTAEYLVARENHQLAAIQVSLREVQGSIAEMERS
jgi:hypothetical protein